MMKLKCRICEKECLSKKQLKQHMKEDHKTKIKCKECTESFDRMSDLEEHIEEIHNIIKQYGCDS